MTQKRIHLVKNCFNCRWRGDESARARCLACWYRPDKPGWEKRERDYDWWDESPTPGA